MVMGEKWMVYLIIAVIIGHFLLAVAYLFYKIYSAPKSNDGERDEKKTNTESNN